MEIMISVNPPYSKMIFSGYKPFEFRSRVLKCMDKDRPPEDIIAYIYETKNKGGVGKVIGEIIIPSAYSLHYADEKYLVTREPVEERFNCIKTLYLYWCNIKSLKPNMNEGWFKSNKFRDYEKEIGFYDADNRLSCNYALLIENPIRYDTAKPITDFLTSKGKVLNKPPQNMCNVIYRIVKKQSTL